MKVLKPKIYHTMQEVKQINSRFLNESHLKYGIYNKYKKVCRLRTTEGIRRYQDTLEMKVQILGKAGKLVKLECLINQKKFLI